MRTGRFHPSGPLVAIAALFAAATAAGLGGCGGQGSSGAGAGALGQGGGAGGGAATQPGGTAAGARLLGPEAAVRSPVALVYELVDAESEPADIAVEFSLDAGATWRPAREAAGAPGHEGTRRLSTSPLGARHAFHWDARADLGVVNAIDVRLRLTPHDGAARTPVESGPFAVIIAGRQDPDCDYDASRGSVVLWADMSGGFTPYSWVVNHVVKMKVYGDGKAVYTDPATGDQVIYQGEVPEEAICALLKRLARGGFWQMQPSYRAPMAPTDLPSAKIAAKLGGGAEKVVSSYGGALSAPPGFMEAYRAILFPELAPERPLRYIRPTISSWELQQGEYPGEEYQKKIDTPLGWTWIDGGPGGVSRWRQ